MQYFPLFVDTHQLKVLVVGGGEVATRKIELLLKTQAQVTVVSPAISDDIQRFVDAGKISHIVGCYHENQLEDRRLVFVATANAELNRQISEQAKARNIFANVVDSQSLCHFITPSIIDRAPMVFAISSEGKAPVLVRYWRERLESIIPMALAKVANFSGEKRQLIKDKFTNGGERRRFWERFFSSSTSDNVSQLESLFQCLVSQSNNIYATLGELYIIETNEDCELLSLAGLRHMQQSDIAVVEQGVSNEVRELVRRDANVAPLSVNDQLQQIEHLLNEGQRVCLLTRQALSEWQYLVNKFSPKFTVRQFHSAASITS